MRERKLYRGSLTSENFFLTGSCSYLAFVLAFVTWLKHVSGGKIENFAVARCICTYFTSVRRFWSYPGLVCRFRSIKFRSSRDIYSMEFFEQDFWRKKIFFFGKRKRSSRRTFVLWWKLKLKIKGLANGIIMKFDFFFFIRTHKCTFQWVRSEMRADANW